MSEIPPPESTTKAVRRVQPRSQRPSGGPLWLGPALGCLTGLCVVIAIGALVVWRPIKGNGTVQVPLVVVTVTPTPIVPTATLRPTDIPQPTPAPTSTPEGLFVGGEALVSGTGSALRLRSDPGLQSTTLKTVSDGTRLKILEGPRDADNLRWWRMQDPTDGAIGWAAETYLTPATGP
ncbi:MAG TPA: SH3 domain-containing protein [Anaerolineae bacterium]|nr:SH3 domain-containing protein [Anaerolineae bacterium]